MQEPQPLIAAPPHEVPLPRAPLVRVIAQVRFPPILAIRNPDNVAVFQEALRETYPILAEDRVRSIDLTAGHTPNVSEGLIWRLADREKDLRWRVSLGVGFVALETSVYDSRRDFLERLRAVVVGLDEAFRPANAKRLGLRYINRLTNKAVERVGDLIRPKVLGIMQPTEDPPTTLGDALVHLMTEAQFLAQEGHIQGRWGKLPPNVTYDPDALEPIAEPSWVLDLDMFTSASQPFVSQELLTTAGHFAERLYSVFREVVTDEFLRFYGGEP